MSNVTNLKNELAQAKNHVAELRGHMQATRVAINHEQARIVELRKKLRFEMDVDRQIRQARREAKNQERIEKMQARLDAMLAKQNTPKARKRAARRSGEVVSWTPEQIAEYNAR